MFGHSLRYLFIVGLAAYSFLNTWSVDIFKYYPIPVHLTGVAVLFLVVIFGIWESNRLINRHLQLQNVPFLRQTAYQFAVSILVTAVITLLAIGAVSQVYAIPLSELGLSLKLFLVFAFRINLFLNTIHVITEYVKQLRKSQMEAEQLKKASVQAELQAIRNQVNPHFLFNNLSVLAALIPKDTNASVDFVQQFSKVYRYVLVSHEKELVTLDEELHFIDAYLFLLEKRFGAALRANINVSAQARKKKLVPVALQMLIENAVKHNIVSERRPLYLTIKDIDSQVLVVQNNLQRRLHDEELSTGIGLSNILQRYAFLGGQTPEVQQTNTDFIVKLPLLSVPNSK
ncbi:MAG: histidine kinase [Cytophagia bacterium]|nr:MAG: histidine kinase [Cytophagales bacterium]TAG43148.1 MAG: histidine kinase [Cytophagia bacterium]TAG68672.1 MAG: histidine kinase [Runella slithyformis]TAG76533.1 MAG: histidine kinase [Cytophagales bacterium]